MRKVMCSLFAVCLVVIWYGSESEYMAQEVEFQPGILSFQGQEYGRNDVVVTMEDMKGYYEYYISNEDVDVKDEREYFQNGMTHTRQMNQNMLAICMYWG